MAITSQPDDLVKPSLATVVFYLASAEAFCCLWCIFEQILSFDINIQLDLDFQIDSPVLPTLCHYTITTTTKSSLLELTVTSQKMFVFCLFVFLCILIGNR